MRVMPKASTYRSADSFSFFLSRQNEIGRFPLVGGHRALKAFKVGFTNPRDIRVVAQKNVKASSGHKVGASLPEIERL